MNESNLPGTPAVSNTTMRHSRWERWLPTLAYALTGVAFYPATVWLLRETLAHQQLFHALLVLMMGGMALGLEQRARLRLAFEFSLLSQVTLLLSYACMATFYWMGHPLLALASYTLAICSAVVFFFGQGVKRAAFTVLGTFALYMLLVLLLPVLDWPMRALAGKNAGWVLSLFGSSVHLELNQSLRVPELIMVHAGRPFHVAAECNGFGLLCASLLLSLMLALYRPLPWIDKGLLIIGAAFLGFIGNVLRIVVIILLAPSVGKHYLLMHEIVGIFFYYGALIAIWWLAAGWAKRTSRA
ncbi:MAG: exosortase/archaeosortase family protein [Verrucomicrobiota bacterium]|nr:exosortase/archaeosortase family protein [Verrucomicrobiota bacterium]